jgi:hypothetical protein
VTRKNNASGSGRMLVDIVLAAMARLPALPLEPRRNFAPVRLESRSGDSCGSWFRRKYMHTEQRCPGASNAVPDQRGYPNGRDQQQSGSLYHSAEGTAWRQKLFTWGVSCARGARVRTGHTSSGACRRGFALCDHHSSQGYPIIDSHFLVNVVKVVLHGSFRNA